MTRMRLLAAVALVWGSLSTAGTAVALESPVHFGLGGGMSVPVGDAGDALKEGFHVRGILSVKPPVLPFGIRGVLGYQKLNLDDTMPGVEGTGKILSGLANLTFGASAGPLRPYVTAGLGAFSVKSELESGSGTTSKTETKFGIDAGVGLEIKLSSLKGFIEAR